MSSSIPTEAESPGFLFITCQRGAESALKSELARRWPTFRLAYSRPGFLTFKLPADHHLPSDVDLQLVFARAHAFSLGKAASSNPEELAAGAWQIAGDRSFDSLHVWQRDTATPGFRGFEPEITPLAKQAEQAILQATPATTVRPATTFPTARGNLVFDCALVEPDQWWLGYHRVASSASRWPGGIPQFRVPAELVSRAYLKMGEALVWSEFPIAPGQSWVEIGCSPGGASQTLLERGLIVTGIDPADVDPRIAEHPNFTHIRKRGADVRRREYRPFDWLTVDINVAPTYTLDTVEAIVTHSAVNIKGMILTLKLLEWELAEEIPAYLERIRGWGYRWVEARQLAHNRQEICVAAALDRSVLKKPRRPRSPQRRNDTPRKRRR